MWCYLHCFSKNDRYIQLSSYLITTALFLNLKKHTHNRIHMCVTKDDLCQLMGWAHSLPIPVNWTALDFSLLAGQNIFWLNYMCLIVRNSKNKTFFVKSLKWLLAKISLDIYYVHDVYPTEKSGLSQTAWQQVGWVTVLEANWCYRILLNVHNRGVMILKPSAKLHL